MREVLPCINAYPLRYFAQNFALFAVKWASMQGHKGHGEVTEGSDKCREMELVN